MEVLNNAIALRKILIANLPNILEQLELPAKMIDYSYGKRYSDLICVIIPSKKGLKLGFNRGVDLPDSYKILEGNGKISRYITINNMDQIKSGEIKQMIQSALQTYEKRMV